MGLYRDFAYIVKGAGGEGGACHRVFHHRDKLGL